MLPRRSELTELGVLELADMILVLEYQLGWARREVERLQRAISLAYCGAIHFECSCQLARGHEGEHAWASPDGADVRRW